MYSNLNLTGSTGAYAFLIVLQILLVLVVAALIVKLILLLKKPKGTASAQKEEKEPAAAKKESTQDEAEEPKKKNKKQTEAEPEKAPKVAAKTAKPSKAENGAVAEEAEEEEEAEETKPNAFVVWWGKVATFFRTGWTKFVGLFHREPKDGEEDETQSEAAISAAGGQRKEKILVVQAAPQVIYVQQPGVQVVQGTAASAPAPAAAPVADSVTAEEDFDDEFDDEIVEESVDGGTVTYNRSFMAKYIQAPDEVKNWYVHLKNRLLSYKKVRANTSWKRESFICGRKPMARLVFRGKTLCLFLPLDPAAFTESKYHVENVSSMTMYTETPCMYRIKNDRRLEYAYELLEMVAKDLGTSLTNVPEKDYYLPYEGIVQLIDKGLVKRVIRHKTTDFINP